MAREMSAAAPYETFISGETVDLVIPNEAAIERDGWHRWFNDPEVTRYSDHGLFPNTAEKQHQYLAALLAPERGRLALLIRPKDKPSVIGVISLSGINWQRRTAQIGMVIGVRARAAGAIFHGLEAKARMAEHAFRTMGLERVWGSQARPLADWQRYQVLFGFRVEGIQRQAFRRGHELHDLVLTACRIEDYLAVVEARGAYWPGRRRMHELMRHLPKESPVDAVAAALDDAVAAYMNKVRLA